MEVVSVCGVFWNICIVFFRTDGVYSVFCITVWRNVCGGKSQKKNVYERHVCTVSSSRRSVVCTFLSGTFQPYHVHQLCQPVQQISLQIIRRLKI